MRARRYDIHPVVRGITAGALHGAEMTLYGRRLVDHFSRQSHGPYDEAATLDDVRGGLHVIRVLIQMGRQQEAFEVYRGGLTGALLMNLEAHAENLSLLRPFFPNGWASLPIGLGEEGTYLANQAGISLRAIGEPVEALAAYGTVLQADLRQSRLREDRIRLRLSNISFVLHDQDRLAAAERCHLLCLDLADLLDNREQLFCARLDRFRQLVQIGRWRDANKIWKLLDPMGRDWNRALYRPGTAEAVFAQLRFWQGTLKEEDLINAESLAEAGRNRSTIRHLHKLRGAWYMERGQWDLAAVCLHDAVRMAREIEQSDSAAETQLVLANFHLGLLNYPRHAAEQLSITRRPNHLDLTALWLAIGDHEQARKHAIAGYKAAWADGEPYVHRYHLNKARVLIEQTGAEIPDLLPYDPAKDEKLPWEDDVAAAIDKLRAEKKGTAKTASKN